MRKRYAYKLGGSMLSLPLNFAMQLMATRALGPGGYGGFTFLSGFFNDVIGFFDSGTSVGFYSKLCSRPNEDGITAYYWKLAASIATMLITGVGIVLIAGQGHRLWPEQKPACIVLAAIYALGVWFAAIAGKIIDAHGLTTPGEKTRLIYRVALVLATGCLFAAAELTLASYFVAQILLAVGFNSGFGSACWRSTDGR